MKEVQILEGSMTAICVESGMLSAQAAVCPCMQTPIYACVQGLIHPEGRFTAQTTLEQNMFATKVAASPCVQIPIYAHVKEVVDPEGRLTAVEINYMKFLAFNGSYKV